MQSFQPCSVWRSMSLVLERIAEHAEVEMVMSRSPIASRSACRAGEVLAVVVCQKNGSKLSKPSGRISPDIARPGPAGWR